MAQSTFNPATGAAGAAPPIFLRKATGLVRQLNTRDVFIIDLLESNPLGNLAVLLPLGLALFAGANLWLSMVTGTIAGLSLVLVYAMLAHAMPRSGGDYIFISRILHPALGFVGSWTMMLITAFFCGYNGWAICNWLLPDVLAPIGVATHNQGLVNLATNLSQTWVITVGVLITAALYFLAGYWGVRTIMRLMWIPVLFTAAALLLAVPYLLFTPYSTFLANFNAFSGHFHTSAAAIEAVARKGGTSLNPAFSLGATVAFWPFVLYVLGYSITSVAMGGEIRNVRRAQYIGVVGSTLVGSAIIALIFGLAVWKIGVPLLTSIGYLTYVNPAANPFPFAMYAQLVISMLSSSPLLLILFSGAVLTNIYFTGPLLQMWGTRYLFAWSMDRVAPPQVGELAGDRNAPVVALAIMAFFTILFGLMLNYLSGFTLVVTGLLQNILLLLVSVAAVIFPWRMRDLYNGSIKWEIGGVPWISILGVWAIVFNLVMVYAYITNSAFGAVTATSLQFAAALVLSGLLYYVVAWLVARRRGIDVGLAYRELPPD